MQNQAPTRRYDTSILMTLSPEAVGSIISSLIKDKDSTELKNEELFEYVADLLEQAEELRIKNRQLEEAMDVAHERMQILTEELALTTDELHLTNDHLMAVANDSETEDFWLKGEMTQMEEELTWLRRELEFERELNDDLIAQNSHLESQVRDFEYAMALGYTDHDAPVESDIPDEAFEAEVVERTVSV